MSNSDGLPASLSELNISKIKFSSELAERFCKNNSHLISLNISENNIGD